MINIGFNTPPKDAYEYLMAKKPKLNISEQELITSAKHKAFTISKIANMDILKDIQNSIISSIKNGDAFNKWKKNIGATLKSKGWDGADIINYDTGEVVGHMTSHRLKTIFMTNARTAYSVGRYKAMMQLEQSVYWRYVGILDTKIRSSHAKQHGIIKHRDDEFWKSHYPPNAYNCRCKVQAFSKDALNDRGWIISDKKIEPFVDKSFDYDLGLFHKEELEAYYYKKALKYHNDCKKQNNSKKDNCLGRIAFKQAIKDIDKNQNLDKKFSSFIDKINKDIKHKQNKIVVAIVNIEVFDYYLNKTNNQIEKPHIYFDKKSFTHMKRELKQDKGIALNIDEIKNIPMMIKNPDMVLWDNKENAILYIYKAINKANKIVLKINYAMKDKNTYNYLRTTSKQADKDIQALIKGGVYEIIK